MWWVVLEFEYLKLIMCVFFVFLRWSLRRVFLGFDIMFWKVELGFFMGWCEIFKVEE